MPKKTPNNSPLRKNRWLLISLALATAVTVAIILIDHRQVAEPPTASELEQLQINSAIITDYHDYPFRWDPSLLEEAGFKVVGRLYPESSPIYGRRYQLPKEYFEIEVMTKKELINDKGQIVNNRRIVGINTVSQGDNNQIKTTEQIDRLFNDGSIEEDRFDYVHTLVDGRTKVEIAHHGHLITVTGLGKERVKALLILVLDKLESSN